MPTDFSADKARNALLKKGFRQKNRDHSCFFYWHNNKKTRVHTKFSHQRRIPPGILNKIRRQIHLTERGQLERLLGL